MHNRLVAAILGLFIAPSYESFAQCVAAHPLRSDTARVRLSALNGGPSGPWTPHETRFATAAATADEVSTLLGGNAGDSVRGIALDGEGNIYVAGETRSPDFPATPGAAFPAIAGSNPDAFVAKLDPSASTILWATFLGGGSSDGAWGIALDDSGNVYVAGMTFASAALPFPTTPNAFDRVANGQDVFLTKLTNDGRIAYSTVFGGNSSDTLFSVANPIAIGPAGDVWLGGETSSGNTFPLTAGAFDTTPSSTDAFVARFDTERSGAASLTYSTFLGGSLIDSLEAVVAAPDGTVYALLSTASSNMPTTPGAFDATFSGQPGFQDMHVARLNPMISGSGALLLGTYLGGRGYDIGTALALDAEGNVYVAGLSSSPDFPTTENAWDPTGEADVGAGGTTPKSHSEGVVTKLRADGGALLYSTYIGSCAEDAVTDLVLDEEGNAYVVGTTGSAAFATTVGARDGTYNGGLSDVFLAKLDTNAPGASSLAYATLFGGNNLDQPASLALGREGRVLVAGVTASADFPTTPGAFDATFAAGDGFVTGFDLRPVIQLATVADEVRALAARILNRGLGQALYEKLDAAGQQLERGNTTAAAAQIRAFINQVEALIAAGDLPVDVGADLVTAANRILAQLSN